MRVKLRRKNKLPFEYIDRRRCVHDIYPLAMYRLLLALALLSLFSCGSKNPEHGRSTINSFYFWQTSLNNFSWRDSLYQAMNVKKVYYRFFDIDWSEEAGAAVPVSPLSMGYWNMEGKSEIIPVVFITNETFKHLSLDASRDLARQVHRRVVPQLYSMLSRKSVYDIYDNEEDCCPDAGPFRIKSEKFDEQRKYDSLIRTAIVSVKQIQFDCDWTASTKEKYFAFLAAAKELFSDMVVTSTLRLYQYKYPQQAGVPPVSRATLMCYNAGDVTKKDTRNSIFDADEIMSYLKDAEAYSIPLDYALPVFSWALVYRENKLRNIISSQVLFDDYGFYLQPGEDDHYRITKDFVYGYTSAAIYLRAKVEEVAGWLGANKNNPDAILTLYHLNDHDLKTYSKEIESIFNSF
jgi:hypothetical protein